MSTPYENATSEFKAREEITKILRRFGCEKIGFMDHFSEYSVELYFEHRGQPVRLNASAKGWAQLYLKEHPWSYRMRGTKHDYEIKAVKQGLVAVNSILRDWIKGQITAVECGMLSFEAVFMPFMLTSEGVTVIDALQRSKLLPSPKEAAE